LLFKGKGKRADDLVSEASTESSATIPVDAGETAARG
jgi:hypothetical protein